MAKATTPDEGVIKARVRAAVQAELGDAFDEAEFDDAFDEAMQEAATYEEAYNKTLELLKQAEDGEQDGQDNRPNTEQAIRKLADSARRKRG